MLSSGHTEDRALKRTTIFLVGLLSLCGCMYRVPLTSGIPDKKMAKALANERCARSNGWKGGVWDARIHTSFDD